MSQLKEPTHTYPVETVERDGEPSVSDDVRKLANYHYDRYRDVYGVVETRLEKARETYLEAPQEERLRRLCKGFTFAVLSIQTPVHVHEDAYERLWRRGEPLADLDDALTSVNYNRQKRVWIREFLTDEDLQRRIDGALVSGEHNRALKIAYDEARGVNTVKAPFMFAMNGFTDFLCIDGNVRFLVGMDKPTTVVPERYRAQSRAVLDQFPALRDNLDPFMVQWVLFDFARGERKFARETVSLHNVWFESIGIV